MKANLSDQGHSQPSIARTMGPNINVEVVDGRASTPRADVSQAKVIAARALSGLSVAEKRHLELQLPSGITYRAGAYCAVLPMNPPQKVHAVMTLLACQQTHCSIYLPELEHPFQLCTLSQRRVSSPHIWSLLNRPRNATSACASKQPTIPRSGHSR